MNDEKRVMEMEQSEFAIIINALMNMRNTMMQEEKETDLVDEVIRKTIKSPTKQKGIFHKKRDDSHAR